MPFRLAVCLLAVIAVCRAELHAGEKTRQPNIVFIIADDMAWNDCGAYGNKGIRTPHLDRLAREGLRYDRAFLTTSSCSPSRSSILTGRYPHNTGAQQLHWPLPGDQVAFTELLRAAGYWTAAVGKWHLGGPAQKKFDLVKQGGGPSGCEQWVPVLRDRPKDKPFFLWLAAFDPHRDYQPGAIEKPHQPRNVVVPPFLPDLPEVRQDLALYYDEIARMDAFIGQVLAELERQGVLDDTLIVFISDNGRPFPRCKTTLYDSGIRTPLLVRWPGRAPAGQTRDCLVSAVDLAPTFLEVAGAKVGPTFQGKSFARTFADPKAKVRDHAFAEHNWHDFDDHQRAVRGPRFLYLRNAYTDVTLSPPADAVRSPTFQAMRRLRDAGKLTPDQQTCFVKPRPKEELYDCAADPFQLRNLATDANHAKTLDEMRGVLDRWIRDTNDVIPARRTPDRYDRETGNALKNTLGKKTKKK